MELFKRLGESEVVLVVDADSEWGDNIAELPVIAFFVDFQNFALFDGLTVVVFGEVEEPLGKAVVRKYESFSRIELNVFHGIYSFTEEA